MEQGNRRTGGQVQVDALRIHGVDTVFCVPGESYLAALDALAARVERTAELPDAFEAALRAGRVALVEPRIDPELITTRATLAQIRGAGAHA